MQAIMYLSSPSVSPTATLQSEREKLHISAALGSGAKSAATRAPQHERQKVLACLAQQCEQGDVETQVAGNIGGCNQRRRAAVPGTVGCDSPQT